jgi:hypothetical protein
MAASSDIPSVIVLNEIEGTTYGLGNYKYGVVRHQQSRMKFKFPDDKD